jgi:hypothetical protein
MSWMTDWGRGVSDGLTDDRCRRLEEQLNDRPDTGKLWRNMLKIGPIVNSKAAQFGGKGTP